MDLVQQQDGSWATSISLVYPEERNAPEGERAAPPERIRRERDRLLRILNFPGLNRHRLVADVIRREWPHLIVPNPLAPGSMVDALDALEPTA